MRIISANQTKNVYSGTILKELMEIIPKDRFYNKRVKNLAKAIDKEILYKNGEVVSVVFINKIYGFKFTTWITNKKYERRGYASKCLFNIKKRHSLLLAKTQKGNIISYKFAIRNGFKRLFNIPKIFNVIVGGTLFYWGKKNYKFIL